MESLLSLALLFLIVIVSVGVLIGASNPIFQSTAKSTEIRNAEADLAFIDRYIQTVAREGKDSVRTFDFSSPKAFESIPGEDAIQYTTDTGTDFLEYLTRSVQGNLIYISGSNVDCFESEALGFTELVAENDKIRAHFRKINGQIDTAYMLREVFVKPTSQTVSVGNTSIVIDDDPSTSVGIGYTEIANSGRQIPVCVIHAFVNSTYDYHVYYKLYAGADFLVTEVKNIS